jgi:RNA polymerase sigma-70 factor (ECF subfamily)
VLDRRSAGVAMINRLRGRRTELGGLADEDLIVLAGARNADAFEAIFDRHAGAAYSLAYRMCGERELAEEIVQEAFLALWRGVGSYQPGRGSLRNWLLGGVRNRMIDAFRARARSVPVAGATAGDEAAAAVPGRADTEAEAISRAEAREIRSALEQLPDEQRRVIELAYFGGLSHTEIAAMLGVPAGTVKGRMRLGLGKLRGNLPTPVEGML